MKYIRYIYVRILVLIVRFGWWQHRRSLGYPISLWHAFTSPYPRFGVFDAHKAGCPERNKELYKEYS